MVPLAMVRFSTTTDWPHSLDSSCATSRATKSVPPPGAVPTSLLTGLSGKACAAAGPSKAAPNMAAQAVNSMRRVLFMLSPGSLYRGGLIILTFAIVDNTHIINSIQHPFQKGYRYAAHHRIVHLRPYIGRAHVCTPVT